MISLSLAGQCMTKSDQSKLEWYPRYLDDDIVDSDISSAFAITFLWSIQYDSMTMIFFLIIPSWMLCFNFYNSKPFLLLERLCQLNVQFLLGFSMIVVWRCTQVVHVTYNFLRGVNSYEKPKCDISRYLFRILLCIFLHQ